VPSRGVEAAWLPRTFKGPFAKRGLPQKPLEDERLVTRDDDDFSTPIVSTGRADPMAQHQFLAVGTRLQIRCVDLVVLRTAHITP